MIKYKTYVKDMYEANKNLFAEFKLLHDLFAKNKKSYQANFNSQGEVIMRILHDWEAKLCGHMEKGNNAVYSARLAEKFWEEVRKTYPLIDFIGVRVNKT
jgi:hypothetical protein